MVETPPTHNPVDNPEISPGVATTHEVTIVNFNFLTVQPSTFLSVEGVAIVPELWANSALVFELTR